MTKYTFRSAKGTKVTVRAMTEEMARTYAMEKLWGMPIGWCKNVGEGLTLIEPEEVAPTLAPTNTEDGQ